MVPAQPVLTWSDYETSSAEWTVSSAVNAVVSEAAPNISEEVLLCQVLEELGPSRETSVEHSREPYSNNYNIFNWEFLTRKV